ncbi:thiamine phosphate synthase [Rhodoferax sp. GW822-FHT02A01]|uniref:thiamine phosphate synthase n=1 Tax=Rhodoferax sp. GW822-FHT02A01 TaxID=3141537 RepID=UPI00315D29F2
MPAQATSASFVPLSGPLGFYPVVPDASWVERLLHWGVRTVQLRFKPASGDDAAVREQVRAAVAAGHAVPGAQVFINDHWRHAIALGAYGVHLGQEDWAALSDAERDALRSSGMRLGLSTHTPAELALAKAARPSYLAIGPVFPTTLKVMPYEPVGLERLQDWARLAAPYPVAAIGGITLECMADVRNCGVDGVAVVSALTQAVDPRFASQQGLRVFEKGPTTGNP